MYSPLTVTVNCLTVVASVDDSLFGLLVREQLAVHIDMD